GLGVNSLYALNLASIFKWIWRFFASSSSLWIKVIKSIHGNSGALDNPYSSRLKNSTWIGILKAINKLKVKGVDLMGFCKIATGNGSTTIFWHDIFLITMAKHEKIISKANMSDFKLASSKVILKSATKFNPPITNKFRTFIIRVNKGSLKVVVSLPSDKGRTVYILPSPNLVGDEIVYPFGWHLEEIHVAWAHLKKIQTRLRLYTIYLKELCIQSVETERGDGVAITKRRHQDFQSDGVMDLATAGDENHIRTLGDYSKPSHEGYMNTIELLEGNNVVPLRSDTIRLVQNGCSFHGLRSEDPNQHLKDFLKLVDSLDLDVANWERTRTIDQSASGMLHDRNAKESWALLEDLALYDNKSWNDPKDFAKPVKAISLPQDVPSISDRRLIELENQVQHLMEAHLAPKQPVQVNKITSSCKIGSGLHDTQYYMENPEQAFVEYASSRTDEAGGKYRYALGRGYLIQLLSSFEEVWGKAGKRAVKFGGKKVYSAVYSNFKKDGGRSCLPQLTLIQRLSHRSTKLEAPECLSRYLMTLIWQLAPSSDHNSISSDLTPVSFLIDEEFEASKPSNTRITSSHSTTPSDSTTPLSPDHPPTQTSPTLTQVSYYRNIVRMAMHTQPTLSPGMSARITEATALSLFSFRKRYRSSYETASPSSSLTLLIRKRYRGTSELVEHIKDESSDLDTKGEGYKDEGPGSEDEGHGSEDGDLGSEEEEAAPEGQQQAVSVVDTSTDEPLGLGFGALRRHELALGEGSVPDKFKIEQSSRSVLEQYRTSPSPEWSSGSLPVLPSSSTVPTLVASPATTPTATIAVDEDKFLEVGAQLELYGSILYDHTHRLDALPPALFEGYDRDLKDLYTKLRAVKDEIFSQRYMLRSLDQEHERATMTSSAIWRPMLALESWTGHVDAQREEMWHDRYDDHRLIHDFLVQNTMMQREYLELRDHVTILEREGSRRGQ
nr:RNA-directed DNA polymerase, eukaryota [Tanacetum cinerariifolium]